MKQPLMQSATIQLDRERQIYFDINANIAFEDAIGKTLIDTMSEISANLRHAEATGTPPPMPSMRIVLALLWAGLRGETLDERGRETEDTLSMHQLGSMLDFGRLMETLQVIGRAFSLSLEGSPTEVPAANPPKTPQRNGKSRTGHGSGVSVTNLASAKRSS